MITSKEIISVSPQKSGRIRVRLKYGLTDGRVFTIGPMSVADMQEANSRLLEKEEGLLESVKDSDSDDALNRGLDTKFREASATEVKMAWLRRAFDEDTHIGAYRKMKRIMPKIVALGNTDAQNSAILGIVIKEFKKLKRYWTFLDANRAVIIACSEIQGGKG